MWRHKKRGTTYNILTEGTMQHSNPMVDFTDVVVYQDINSGRVWVRPKSEFYDGRFEKIANRGHTPIVQ